MKYLLLLAAMTGLAFSIEPVRAASDDAAFTPTQRDAIVRIMREALQNDPTILSDAIKSLRTKAEQQAQNTMLTFVQKHKDALQSAPYFAIRGNPHGKITVVEFYDPRCGYCRHMVPIVDQFLARHPDVRLVEKLVPVLGKGSVIDARAIIAASNQGKYEVICRALMKDNADPSMDRVSEVAKANGLDMTRFKADMSSFQTVALISTNLDQGRAIGLDGTPTFIFGTSAVIPGALAPEQMDELLEQARKFDH